MSANIVRLFSEEQYLTLDNVASRTGIHPALVRCFVEFGLIRASAERDDDLFFEPAVLPRLRMIVRLRESLGINLAGISVILDMRDRILELQKRSARGALR